MHCISMPSQFSCIFETRKPNGEKKKRNKMSKIQINNKQFTCNFHRWLSFRLFLILIFVWLLQFSSFLFSTFGRFGIIVVLFWFFVITRFRLVVQLFFRTEKVTSSQLQLIRCGRLQLTNCKAWSWFIIWKATHNCWILFFLFHSIRWHLNWNGMTIVHYRNRIISAQNSLSLSRWPLKSYSHFRMRSKNSTQF